MKELRIHGRGGQGAVTTAELLALAAIEEGRYAQAFPSFGPERRGAPVTAFSRISEKPIRIRSKVYEPDIVIVLDQSLLGLVPVEDGLKEQGIIVANCSEVPRNFVSKLKDGQRFYYVDANSIAAETLGRPITNTTMIGALLGATSIVTMESLERPVRDRFGRLADRNLEAIRRAFQAVRPGT